MSYVIHIVDQVVPEDNAEANAMLSRLIEDESDQERGASDPLLRLYHRLIALYPCNSSRGDDEEWYWLSAPLLSEFGQHVASLGIATPYVSQVLKDVLQFAGELNLTVFDDQAGEIYRPNSALSLNTMNELSREINATSELSVKIIEEALYKMVMPVVAPLGFTWSTEVVLNSTYYVCSRTVEYGVQRIEFSIYDLESCFNIRSCIRIVMPELLPLFLEVFAPSFQDANELSISLYNWFFGKDADPTLDFIRDHKSLHTQLKHIRTIVTKHYIPFFERATSVSAVNSLVNTPGYYIGAAQSMYAVMILAYYVDPSILQSVYEAHCEDRVKEVSTLKDYHRIYSKIRDHQNSKNT